MVKHKVKKLKKEPVDYYCPSTCYASETLRACGLCGLCGLAPSMEYLWRLAPVRGVVKHRVSSPRSASKKKKKHQLIVRDDPVLSHGRARAHLHLHLPLSLPLTNCALPGVEVGLRRSVGDYSEETKGKRQPSGVACRVNGCDHRKTAALELSMDMGAKYSVVTHRTTSGYTYCISHPIYPV